MVVGALETLDRLVRSLYVVKFPGLKNSLAGVYVANRMPVSWQQLQRPSSGHFVLTTRADAGDAYLRGVCGYSELMPDTFESISDQSEGSIRKKLLQVFRDKPRRPIVFFGAQDVCVKLVEGAAIETDGLKLKFIETADDGSIPSFDAGIAVLHDPEWIMLLEKAIEYMVRTAPEQLSDMYADLFVDRVPLDEPIGHDFAFARLHALNTPNCEKFLNRLHAKLAFRFAGLNVPQSFGAASFTLQLAFKAAGLKLPATSKTKKRAGSK